IAEVESHGQRPIPVIRDAAHCAPHGAGREARLADFTAYSFQAIKFVTCGDGGALVTPNEFVERARLLRWYGLDRATNRDRSTQRITEAGYKWHMNDIAASIGLANLELGMREDRLLIPARGPLGERRRTAAFYYSKLWPHVRGETRPQSRLLAIPTASDRDALDHDWWLYTIHVEDRDRFVAFAKRRGVECSLVHVRNDYHPVFDGPARPAKLPGVDFFAKHQVAIPIGSHLDAEKREVVANTVIDWAEGADR
ncbi:MAG TPA: DegT/DnrJ/EryC1/StrS family aminotransferase, partial [Acidimicrobiales bacterium]